MLSLEVSIFNLGLASQKFLSILLMSEFWIFDKRENRACSFGPILLPFESVFVVGNIVLGPKSLHLGSVLRRFCISSIVYALLSFPTNVLSKIIPQFKQTLFPSRASMLGLSQH